MDFMAMVNGVPRTANAATSHQLRVVDRYGLPKFPGDESHAKQWVENCPCCQKPMLKLQPVKKGIFLPDPDSIAYGQCRSDLNAKDKIELWITQMREDPKLAEAFHYQPAWNCPECVLLWGEVSGYWAQFKEKDLVLQKAA